MACVILLGVGSGQAAPRVLPMRTWRGARVLGGADLGRIGSHVARINVGLESSVIRATVTRWFSARGMPHTDLADLARRFSG